MNRFSRLSGLLCASVIWLAQSAAAAPFTVTTTADSGTGSLRQAILDANAAPGADDINFAIPGTGVQVITPGFALPDITDPVLIDAYTQPGASANTLAVGNNAVILIQINACCQDGGPGLRITTQDSTIRGFSIIGGDPGIHVNGSGATGNTVEGNFLGLNPDGVTASPNVRGVVVDAGASGNTVGGALPAARNVSSFNTFTGISVAGASGTVVIGNYFGTDASGMTSVANGLHGVEVFVGSQNTTIGGTNPGEGNVISGNGYGVRIGTAGTNGTVVIGNLIGLNAAGTGPLGNFNEGVRIDEPGADNNRIGGTATGEGNHIAFNSSAGVAFLGGAVGNSIIGNSIHDNGGLGIDLDLNGVTPNDSLDADTGTNDLQNYPVITSVQFDGSSTTIAVTLESTPSRLFHIDFYSSPAVDSSGFGEGQTYLGRTIMSTDGSGMGSTTFVIGLDLTGSYIAATATPATGSISTSEFSQAVLAPFATGPDLFVDISDSPDPALVNDNFSVTVFFQNIGNVDAASNATLTIDLPDGAMLAAGPSTSFGTTCSSTGSSPEFTCTTPVLTQGASGSVFFDLTVATPGTVTTTATITTPDAEQTLANNTDSETTRIITTLNLIVTTQNDELDVNPGDGICQSASGCSLRAAIEESNSQPTIDTITIPAGTYTLTIPGSGEDSNQTGDLDILDPVVITGASAIGTIIQGANGDRIFDIDLGCCFDQVSMSNLTIRDGSAPGTEVGGGVRITGDARLNVDFVEFANNAAHDGGALYVAVFTASARREPGNPDQAKKNSPPLEETGACCSGQVTVDNSAFVGNTAVASGGALSVAAGSVGVRNTTFGLNTAGVVGGAIALNVGDCCSSLNTEFITVSNNSAPSGGGIYAANSAFPSFSHSIIANNTGGDCFAVGSGFISQGYNINEDGSCGFDNTGDLTGDPLLAPLTKLGSQTSYFGLLTGSQAIDAGNPFFLGLTDQRDLPRPTDGDGDSMAVVDIGSVETQPEAEVSIAKSGPATTTPGSAITYTISVTNGGPNTADPVTVNDSFSAGTFVSATGPCTGGFPCNVGPLAVGQTVMVNATYAVSPSASGSLTNTATVSAPQTDFNTANNTSSAISSITPTSDLSMTKTGPSFVTAGQSVVYTTTVSNNGPSPANNVIISDPTPAGLTFLSNTGACTGPFPCNVGVIASGGSATITSTYLVSPSATGTITNTASATSDSADPNSANNSATIISSVTVSGDLTIVKNGPTSVLAGQNITYTIDVNNPGPSDATGVMVSDPTPPGTTFVSNTGACTTVFPCNIGTLMPGQTASITATYSVSASASGSVTNTATVSSTTPDTNTTNNSASTTATIASQTDVSITKTGPATASSGDTVVYTVTVSNNGPSPAQNITINDTTPAGLTFVSNTGSCTSPYPCSGGTLNAGQSKTITSTYTLNAGATGSITNTASVTTTTTETNTANNSASATTNIGGCPQSAPTTLLPANGAENVSQTGRLNWSNTGATTYNLYFGPVGSGCSTLVFSGSSTSHPYFNLTAGQEYEWRVEGLRNGCPTLSSACVKFRAVTSATCPAPPALISPTSGTVSSPVTFRFTGVEGATLYTLTINGATAGTTTETDFTVDIPSGPLTWSVTAAVPGCNALQSESATLNICNAPSAPLPSVVGEAATGQTYRVEWTTVPEAVRYELQESLDPEFDSVNDTFTLTGNFRDFEKNIVNPPVGFYYRVRAIGSCGELAGPYSEIIRVVIVPIPANPNVSIPAGSMEVVLQTIFVPGDEGITSQFTATTDQPWLTVRPSSGLLPPEGVTLSIVADPSTLSNGTFTGTVILELNDVSTLRADGRLSPDQGSSTSKKKQIPVSISLVTPITPQQRTTPANDSLIIPSVGHLDGINSRFQSDVRIANTSLNRLRYQISFNQAGQDPGRPIKQTFVDVQGNGTIALDDIVKNFFGIGGLGDQGAGFIEIRPSGGSNTLSPELDGSGLPRASRVTVASSRTYNVSSNGTLGQFIPAQVFSGFISKAGGPFAQALSLQQISQNSAFRTNVGLVEASGLPVSVLMSVFNAAGDKLLEIPADLKGGELRQFNGLLAQNGITLADGRVEARVLSGDGRVTAYASVIENATNDPLLVSGVALGQIRAQRFVFPGAGSLTSAAARFRTDMRIFNSGAPQTATLTFYPQNGAAVSRDLVLNTGEVRILDDVVGTLFGVQGAGAVHVNTPTDAALIVSGRTYADTDRGRFGQFIEAVTPDEAVGRADSALQILQVEDSPRYRTNIGLAEVTGKPAMVEVLVFLPDSRTVPRVMIPMGANEFRQFQLLKELGLGNTYNARVTVRVMEGEGRVTAYGSVVDEASQDPTYIKAQ